MSGRQSSAVDKALKLVSQGKTAYRAAKLTDISLSTIYRSLKRHGIVLPKRDKRAATGL